MRAIGLPAILKARLLAGYLGENAQCTGRPATLHEAFSRLFREKIFSKKAQIEWNKGAQRQRSKFEPNTNTLPAST